MPVSLQKQNIDIRLKSPQQKISAFANNQFWKRNLTNNDYLLLYNRQGIGFKALNKRANDLFDTNFNTKNQKMADAIEQYNLHNLNLFSYLNAQISGYCLIFIAYADGKNYSEKVAGNPGIDYFYSITITWIQQDKFYNNQINDYYEIYRADGSTFKIHETRVIRYARNPNELSAFKPAYNALFVCDNVLWSIGQAIFRVGQGFPHLKINEPEIFTVNGVQTNEVEIVKNTGVMKDINSETGLITDNRYNLEFVGAGGVALRPKEYWDICFTSACIALEIPRQLIEGVSAGAVTGSETNLKDYYSDLSAIQKREIQPLYKIQMGLLGIPVNDTDFQWNPLFELSQKELSEALNQDSMSFERLINAGVLSAEHAGKILSEKYQEFKIIQSAPLNEPEPTISKGMIKNQDQFSTAAQPPFKKAEFREKIDFIIRDKKQDVLEKKFFNEIKKRLKVIEDTVISIIQGYNTDSANNPSPPYKEGDV